MRNLLAKQPTIQQPIYLANPVFHPPISILHPFLSLGVPSSHPTPEPASGTGVASAAANPLPRLRFVRIAASILTSVGWAMVFVREKSKKQRKKKDEKINETWKLAFQESYACAFLSQQLVGILVSPFHKSSETEF